MKILYIGDYDRDYSRHKILLKGLGMNVAKITEYRIDPKLGKMAKYKEVFRGIKKNSRSVDVIIIAYSTSRFVWFARLLTSKTICWDPFFSLYDNWIFDRKLAGPKSAKAFYYWIIDWICFQAADVVLVDTNAQIGYFSKMFLVNSKKMIRVLVGSDVKRADYKEETAPNEKFTALFYGTYIPVQGADILVRAAKLLENKEISIIMIGQGQDFSRVKKIQEEMSVKNINFITKLPFRELCQHIAKADICLGLLSDLPRANRSIPNKIYDGAAMGKACINANTPAIREIFEDKISIILFRGGDPEDLADKILFLKNDPESRRAIGAKALEVIRKYGTAEEIGRVLANDIELKIKKQYVQAK